VWVAFARQRDPRLHFLSFALHPRPMWRGIMGDGGGDEDEDAAVGGARNMFVYAQAWSEVRACRATTVFTALNI
jgi:hypothetical protein